MNNSDDNQTDLNNFYNRYTAYTDIQILEILRNHKDYRESAKNAAVQIAIERKIINSEQDLLSPEYQNVKIFKFSIFPEIKNAYHLQRLAGSIFRFLYVMALVPIIYGFLKYGEGLIDQAYLGVGIGVLWFSFALLLQNTRKPIFFFLLFSMLLILSIFAGFKIFTSENYLIMDLVMLFIGILLPSYLMIYLKKLIQNPS